MKRILVNVSALVLMLCVSTSAQALDFDFFGTFDNHNEVRVFSFIVGEQSNVTIFSSSWDDGGFDPMLGLWTAAGVGIEFQDDGHEIGSTISNGVSYTHGNWDSYYTRLLDAGSYLVSIGAYNNWPNNYDLLSAGFSFDGANPVPIDQWYQPANGSVTGDYAFHILNVAQATDVTHPVPEPATLALLCLGGLPLAYGRLRGRRN